MGWEISEMKDFTIIVKLLSISFCKSGKVIIMGFTILRTVMDTSFKFGIYSEIKITCSQCFFNNTVGNDTRIYRFASSKTLSMRCRVHQDTWAVATNDKISKTHFLLTESHIGHDSYKVSFRTFIFGVFIVERYCNSCS